MVKKPSPPPAHQAQTLKVQTIAQLMTPAQCAEYLQVSIDTLYVWTSNRKIPFRKAGGALRFDFDEIVAWTKGGIVSSHQETDDERQ